MHRRDYVTTHHDAWRVTHRLIRTSLSWVRQSELERIAVVCDDEPFFCSLVGSLVESLGYISLSTGAKPVPRIPSAITAVVRAGTIGA